MNCSSCNKKFNRLGISFLRQGKDVFCSKCNQCFFVSSPLSFNGIDFYLLALPVVLFILPYLKTSSESLSVLQAIFVAMIGISLAELGYMYNCKKVKLSTFSQIKSSCDVKKNVGKMILRLTYLFILMSGIMYLRDSLTIVKILSLFFFLVFLVIVLDLLEFKSFRKL